MNTKRLGRTIAVTVVAATLSAAAVFAAEKPIDLSAQTGLKETGISHAGYGERSVGDITAALIQILISFAGIVLVVLNIYAGFLWMTAQGDEAKIKKARSIIKSSVIGLLMIFGSYVVLVAILNAMGGRAGAGGGGGGPAYSQPSDTFQNLPDVTEELYGSSDPDDPLQGVDF